MSVSHLVWPRARLHEALPLFAQQIGYRVAVQPLPVAPNHTASVEEINGWLNRAAQLLEIECQPVEVVYPEFKDLLIRAAPALLALPKEHEGDFLLLVAGNRRYLTLLGLDGQKYRVTLDKILPLFTSSAEKVVKPIFKEMVHTLKISQARRTRIINALMHEQLRQQKMPAVWLLRLAPGDSFLKQLRHAAIPTHLVTILGSTLLFQMLIILSWSVLGKHLFHDASLDYGVHLWLLLLLTAIPLQVLSIQEKNRLSIRFGMLLRNRLLEGILKLDPQEVRHQGSGQFLGQVMDIELLESQSLSMAFISLIALVQLFLAFFILLMGAGGLLHGLLLLGYLLILFFLSYLFYQRTTPWLEHHRKISCDLAERMVGHRTRLVQERPEDHHKTEDALLAHQIALGYHQIKVIALIKGVAGRRGWLLLSLLVLLPELTSPISDWQKIVIALGGMLFAASALDQLSQSLRHFLQAMSAWKQLAPLYRSAARTKAVPQNFLSHPLKDQIDSTALLYGEQLNFSYATRPVIDACHLKIHVGERILLEGSSGSGKSTLAALLAGLQRPQKGVLHLFGLTMNQLGEDAWRQRIVIAPQFHENHIITETLAFNLLMGSTWPPSRDALIEAETICRELGLGDLIDTMPAGMEQMMGESGWRLSHGESSRLFIARTLLQKADLIILDESFAALDPKTLQITLHCVLRRSSALLLITHP
ncbi:ATP-binding cassette domain-containing protein [Magnetococcales bacterium HHB-1]